MLCARWPRIQCFARFFNYKNDRQNACGKKWIGCQMPNNKLASSMFNWMRWKLILLFIDNSCESPNPNSVIVKTTFFPFVFCFAFWFTFNFLFSTFMVKKKKNKKKKNRPLQDCSQSIWSNLPIHRVATV